jgi:hypothetical protein
MSTNHLEFAELTNLPERLPEAIDTMAPSKYEEYKRNNNLMKRKCCLLLHLVVP